MIAGRKALVRAACLGVLVWVSSTATSSQTLPRTSGPALPLYRALRTDGLDSQQVYKIREAVIDREDVHLWLNDGTIAFTQSIAGKITGAFFRGEGEVLIRPPDRQERASLGLFTGQGVLEEHFSTLYLRFNDDTAAELQPYLRPADDAAEFVKRNDEAARLLAPMDAMRLAISFTSAPATVPAADRAPAPDRMLHARVGGDRLGTFDLYFDARAPEQIVVGQVTTAHNEPYYDLWMSFVMRSVRSESAPASRFLGQPVHHSCRDRSIAWAVSRGITGRAGAAGWVAHRAVRALAAVAVEVGEDG